MAISEVMIGIIKWAQLKMTPTVDGIWCIHCRKHRTVRRGRVVETNNRRRPQKRMIGTCLTCEGETSTFVAH